ncbi:MAG: hypothetical protein WB660_27445, partial [Candidatus Sulfotelmatobacter sp.]
MGSLETPPRPKTGSGLGCRPGRNDKASFVANRHRGTGRPASPATPPDMRVRIRRFGGLSRAHDHRRESELGK